MRAVWSSVVALAIAGTMSSCGGGGGGGGGSGGGDDRLGSGGTSTRFGPADMQTEANRNYGLQAVGATSAQAAGLDGTGIKVGIIDSGIDLEHPDFAGAIDPASTDIVSGIAANVDDQGGHGTSVAGVIGARKDGYDSVGVAPGATLLAVRADSNCASGCVFYHSDLARATDYALANGAKVMNFSLGGGALDSAYSQALQRALDAGAVIVAAAGNTGGANPIDPANFLATNATGNGLAVGAVDSHNALTSFSNRAGAAKNHFLVAPGVNIVTTQNGGGIHTVNGTSFAAPHVSGAAAAVWGASPFLTGTQVVDILLNSATDLGAPGVDDTYGHGMVNLDRAMQALGTEVVPTGSSANDGGAALSSTSVSLGGAFGDSLSRSTALSQAITLDAYGRPFRTDLSAAVKAAPKADRFSAWLAPGQGNVTTSRLGERTSLTLASPPEPDPLDLREDQQPPRFALSTELAGTRLGTARGFGLDRLTGLAAAAPETQGPAVLGDARATPYLGLAGDTSAVVAGRELGQGFGFTLGFAQGEDDRSAGLAELTRRFEDGSVIGAQAGQLAEKSGPLASAASGAFDFGRGADTRFVGLFGAHPVAGGLTLFGRWALGSTDGSALDSGLLRDTGTIISQSTAVGAAWQDWAFSVSRPLMVTGGSATLWVPDGRAMDGSIHYRQERVDLRPSGAETDLELSWSLRENLVLGGMVALQPGHVADAPPAYGAGLKYRLAW